MCSAHRKKCDDDDEGGGGGIGGVLDDCRIAGRSIDVFEIRRQNGNVPRLNRNVNVGSQPILNRPSCYLSYRFAAFFMLFFFLFFVLFTWFYGETSAGNMARVGRTGGVRRRRRKRMGEGKRHGVTRRKNIRLHCSLFAQGTACQSELLCTSLSFLSTERMSPWTGQGPAIFGQFYSFISLICIILLGFGRSLYSWYCISKKSMNFEKIKNRNSENFQIAKFKFRKIENFVN